MVNQRSKIMTYVYDNENLKVDNICPECGGKVICKEEDYGLNQIRQGLFCENCQDWIMQTCYSKLSLDNTQYQLTFSLNGTVEAARKEILSMCLRDHPTQQQSEKTDISITDNAEFLYGIIQRLKGFKITYEVHPPYPYEVIAWDGYMDEDFLHELAKLNPGLDVEGVLRAQQDGKK